ncbi:MAG: dihydrolipoyl dehydrogenase [Rickettsiales bacterium]
MEEFDVVVIGGGPGGYVAAIRSAQLGLKTACIEKRGALGGTCLNVGCIPSKALLNSSEKYEQAKHEFSEIGVECKDVKLNLEKMLGKKNEIVSSLCTGIEGLFKKNKITYFKGEGSFKSKDTIFVKGQTNQEIKTKNTIIATGSEVASLPGVAIDEKSIVSSTGALDLPTVPKKLVVIGGGFIGLEMGSVWRRLGAEVEVIEFLDHIVPGMDGEVGKQLLKILQKQGMKFRLSTKVVAAKSQKGKVSIKIESVDGKKKEQLECDVLLVAVGRKPYTQGLGLDKLGVNVSDRGVIETDEHFKTNVPGIYAIGDVIKGPMLAHKAEDEGVAVAEIIAGKVGHVNYNTIPGVMYTWPEVASVGKTEEQLKKEDKEYVVGKFPFLANSRARAIGSTDGMVKILSCKKTDEVLGVHILGPEAGTMIAEAVLAMEYYASSEDIAMTCHAHPTLNEAVKEAALSVLNRAIHI